jgi:hypothetical protein
MTHNNERDVANIRLMDPRTHYRVLYDMGMRIPEIAKQCEVSAPTVRKYLRQAGLAMKPHAWHLRHPHRSFQYA